MPDIRELRVETARKLRDNKAPLASKTSLVGFDGFVDEIVRMVDKRESLQRFTTIGELSSLARRISQAAGKSTNIELIVQQVKIGGNGPIMANALTAFGLPLTYIGILGNPNLHSVFEDFATRARVFSLGEPAHTDALEFDDGKIMLGKLEALDEITWENFIAKIGLETLVEVFDCDVTGNVNWTMTPQMSNIWERWLEEICPRLSRARESRLLFFDLADPEKRTAADLRRALELIGRFEQYYRVTLGLNEKESIEIAEVLGLAVQPDDPAALLKLASEIRRMLALTSVVIHPRSYAVAAIEGEAALMEGPFTPKPLISTGAGDHFNAGYCVGSLLNLPLAGCLLAGVASSGYYVRTGKSPDVDELASFLENWPASAQDSNLEAG